MMVTATTMVMMMLMMMLWRRNKPLNRYWKKKKNVRDCLNGGGGPQIGEVTSARSPHLSCKRDQINMGGYMERPVTPPKRVTSPTWGPPPPCKQALRMTFLNFKNRESTRGQYEDHPVFIVIDISSYGIYIWNVTLQGGWKTLPR